MHRQTTPFVCHVFVCVNDRQGREKSCADGLGATLKDALKQGVEKRGWKGRVRVSHSGCMGLCQRGPNVMIHPQAIWFSEVTTADVEPILDSVAPLVSRA